MRSISPIRIVLAAVVVAFLAGCPHRQPEGPDYDDGSVKKPEPPRVVEVAHPE